MKHSLTFLLIGYLMLFFVSCYFITGLLEEGMGIVIFSVVALMVIIGVIALKPSKE